jgi:membrane-bound serine protease (ClpP class)
MVALGITLLLTGAALVVADLHIASGVLTATAGISLIAGWAILIGALGGGAVIAVPVGIALGTVGAVRGLKVTRNAAPLRHIGVRAGAESLSGRVGVVRSWHGSAGRVFVEGALWRARQEWPDPAPEELHEGDSVVVERVSGLTLRVRRAEDWELVA